MRISDWSSDVCSSDLLVVALAGGAMADRIGTDLAGDLDLALGDQRPGDRGAEQVEALVHGIGAEHREDEVADEFLAHILDEELPDAEHLGLLACRFQLFALAEVGGEGERKSTRLTSSHSCASRMP